MHRSDTAAQDGSTPSRPNVCEKAKYSYRICHKHGNTEHVLESKQRYYRCKQCRVEQVIKQRRKVKRRLIEWFGGKCIVCGYNKCQEALQFHHLNPETKEFTIAANTNHIAFAKLLAEAQKCILVCANCHAELESGLITYDTTERC